MTTALAAAHASGDPELGAIGGLTGLVLSIVDALGAVGVGLLLFVETVFPPIPSEAILPLAGFLGGAGRMDIGLVIALATAGSTLGALVLYWLGARIGFERTVRWLGRFPLVDEQDFRKAADWFVRHGRMSVFLGRLVPIVRSLISLPAGADRMHLGVFTLLTVLGSGLWNSVLILGGAALGSQYERIEAWSAWIDRAAYAGLLVLLVTLVVRAVRRRAAVRGRADRAS
jgi:membrane protein DedA with SNARE-associated domain